MSYIDILKYFKELFSLLFYITLASALKDIIFIMLLIMMHKQVK